MDGLLVVDKPAGPTSHDVVARMRHVLGERRVGHTGTLDPAATGVLPLVVGRATRLARFLGADEKRYEADFYLGVATDTYDAEGTPRGVRHHGPLPSRDAIESALEGFRGTFVQQPPAYSAKKIAGRPSYKMARRPGPPELPEPVPVTVHALDLISVDENRVRVHVDCSAGFYVRSLAHDLGARLGTGAHLLKLRRTRSGDFTLADAVPFESAVRDRATALGALIPLAQMLPKLAALVLTDDGVRRATQGRDLGPDDIVSGLPTSAQPCVRLFHPHGELIGIAEAAGTPGFLHPSVVLR